MPSHAESSGDPGRERSTASDVQIRRFRWQDLEQFTHAFNEVNGIASTEKAFDVQFMRESLSLPDRDPERDCFLAENRGTITGFVLITPELRIGRAVVSAGVLRPHRMRGTGHLLIKKAVSHALTLGASVLHVETPADAVDAHRLLESEGFRVVRTYWQMRWQDGRVPPVRLPRGFSLRPFRLGEDEAALAQLQNTAFEQNWGFCPNNVEEIRARVRLSRGDPEGIIFVVQGERPVAYNWTLMSSNEAGSIGWISMTGVDPDYQGRGLGRTVVLAGMQYLKSKGVGAIELEVDSANTPARELYLKLGFEKVKEVLWYEKRLGE